jgi:hypothetical protein
MRRTLFSLLLKERDLLGWEAFCVHFAATGRQLARETGVRRLATASVGRTTFDRWTSDTWSGRPRSESAQILERMLGRTIEELFGPAPDATGSGAALESVASRIGSRWPTSTFLLPAGEPSGIWEISGRQRLDGTSAAVHLLPVVRRHEEAAVHGLDHDGRRELERFLRPARRGFPCAQPRSPCRRAVPLPGPTGPSRTACPHRPSRKVTSWRRLSQPFRWATGSFA